MTEWEINIAIAEACGWTKEVGCTGIIRWRNDKELSDALPNYCHDLNAMHEAEKTLSAVRSIVYRTFLALIVEDDPTNRHNERAFATDRQRAEAFLRTLGKWEEKKSDFS